MTEVFDCFTFSSELDLLEFRLGYLWDVVDHFVLAEAPRTHSGLDKPLLFADHPDRFGPFLDKVIHVVVDDLPDPTPDRWVPETFQRRALLRGLIDAAPDDVILVNDVDEIPDATVVGRLRDELDGPTVLGMRACYLRANWAAPQLWPLSRATRFARMDDPDALRSSRPLTQIADAGTHFSYLMEPVEIETKFTWFAHEEFDDARSRDLDFLEAMQRAAVASTNGTALTVLPPERLNPVQESLLAWRPAFFDFQPRPALVQRAARTWWRLRRSGRLGLSDRAVRLGDRTLAQSTSSALRLAERMAR